MSEPNSQTKRTAKYQSKFDKIRIMVPKGEKAKIQEYAEAHGESMTSFILRLVHEAMNKGQ